MCFTLLQGFLLQPGKINVKPESLGRRRAEACFLACLRNSKLARGRRSEEVVVLRDYRSNLKPGLWFKNIFKSEGWVFFVVRCLRATAIRVASFPLRVFFSLLTFGGISWSSGDFAKISRDCCWKGKSALPSTLGWHQECNLLCPSASPLELI